MDWNLFFSNSINSQNFVKISLILFLYQVFIELHTLFVTWISFHATRIWSLIDVFTLNKISISLSTTLSFQFFPNVIPVLFTGCVPSLLSRVRWLKFIIVWLCKDGGLLGSLFDTHAYKKVKMGLIINWNYGTILLIKLKRWCILN